MLSQRQLFLNHLAQTSPAPIALEIESAQGVYLTDIKGKTYIDFISGISVSSLGHRHPAVLHAIQQQLDKYMHLMVYGEFIQTPQVMLGQLLASVLPEQLSSVYFVNSGSEAIEGALKLAKRITGRTNMIGFSNSYHGSSHGALSMMGNEYFKQAFRPLLPGITIAEPNNFDQLSWIDNSTACVLIEPIQGEAGALEIENSFLIALRKRCNETGAVLIFDEIQTGMGRTGSLFAFQHSTVIPDILVLGKAFGGGMPLGAFISSKENMDLLSHQPVLGHITTFGGHPVCCAAGLASLKVLLDTSYIADVAAKEQLIRKLLQHPKIKRISGKGLLLALHFENAQINHEVIKICIENGLIVDWFLFAENCMRIAPPLTITITQIEESCNIILRALN